MSECIRKIKVLFICHGNICRSPMAEYIMKKMVSDKGMGDSFEIASAATSTEELGCDIYPPAKKCLREHGIPFEPRRARQMDRHDLEYYDIIVAMDERNIRNLERMFGASDKYALLLDYTDEPGDISDPWYSGRFEEVFEEIYKGCRSMLTALSDNFHIK